MDSAANSIIAQLRQAFSIRWAWAYLNLPGQPGTSCSSPFRGDRHPSFCIYPSTQGERWFDQATREGGDIVDFWVKARAITIPEAIKELMAMPGSGFEPPAPKKPTAMQLPPDTRLPTQDECRLLGQLRSLPADCFALAARLGTLKVGTIDHFVSWIITDLSGKVAEGRRFDGELYQPRSVKSKAIWGSQKNWPVGIQTFNSDFNTLKNLLLVEGAPDYFAALSLALRSNINFRPCAMLGAALSLELNVKDFIEGTRVVIIPHNDVDGVRAIKRWTHQLLLLGADSVFVQRLPSEAKDLNDLLWLQPDQCDDLLKGFQSANSTPATSI